MRRLLIVGLVLLATAAHAAELAPLQPMRQQLDGDTIASIVYARTPQGFEVVTTVEQAAETGPLILRLSTVLLPGQWTEIVVPREMGQSSAVLRLVRDGDTLRAEPRPSLVALRQ